MSIFEYDKEEEEKKLRRAEYEAGKEDKAKETARLLFQEGDSIEKIARVLKVSKNTIRQWIEK